MTPRFGRRTSVRRRVAALVGIVAVALAGCGGPGGTRAAPAAPVAVTAAAVAPAPRLNHVFVIVLENTEYDAVLHDPTPAPYLRSLLAQGALQTSYYAVAHPSLPNYLALVSGDTHGIRSDCTRCFIDAPNLADQVEAAGRTWRAYMEGMPAPCTPGNVDGYVQKHDPWLYFDDIRTNAARCASHVVPLTRLATDLASDRAPDLAWITPDLCHDMHDCSVTDGDAWLRGFLPSILESAAYRDHGAIFITFDEGTTGASCCGAGGGGRVLTLVLGPDVRAGFRSPVPATHYSLLRTIEDAWGLAPLGHAADATPLAADFRPAE